MIKKILMIICIAISVTTKAQEYIPNLEVETLNAFESVTTDTFTVRKQLISLLPTGTAPFVVSSTNKVVNLNVDRLDSMSSEDFPLKTTANVYSGIQSYSTGFTFDNDRQIVDKAYVDAVATGNMPKLPVDVATTTNITLSGVQTIDSYLVSEGQRVLVNHQSTQSENGVYIVTSGVWSRSSDLDTWIELYKAYVAVLNGGQSGSSFVCNIPSTGTLESDPITWVLYTSSTNIMAGDGLTKIGNTLSANYGGTGTAVTISRSDHTQNFSTITNTPTLTINGTGYDLSSNRTWNVGTVTSISAGLGLSGGMITSSGTILLDTASTSVLSRQRAANTYQPIGSYLTSEVDGSTTNEIQNLSRAGNTLSLSGDGTTVDLSDLVNPDLSNYATTTQLRDSVAYLKTLIPTVETTATIKTKLGIATNSTDGYLLATDWTTFNAKQATLVSGTNIKTVNSTSLLGSGNISIAPMVYPSQGLAKSNGTGWDASITDNSALWNRAVTVSDSLKNDVLDTSSVNINKPNWTKFIQSVTAVQGIPKVGDFYGGGYVYYISESGTYGYCVYPSVIKTGIQWSPTNNNAQIVSNRVVGAGISNTTTIVSVFGAGNYAAYVCDTLNYGGYSDWALPSIGDIDLIHDSLYSVFPESNPERYYCSNDTTTAAYTYIWGTGTLITTAKGTAIYLDQKGVLAVRRFVVATQNFNLNVAESDGSPSYSGINAIQFANCIISQPTSNTALITPSTGSNMTGDQIVTALNTTTSVNLTKPLYSTELGMNGTGYNYFWSQYYDDAYHYGVYLAQSPKGSYSRELRYDASDNILYVPRINLENGGYVNSIGTGAATGSSTTKLVTEDMLAKSIQASGGGDMSRSVYDVDVDNIVDNSEKLGGQLPSYYMPNVAAGTVSLGGIQVSATDGGLAMSGNYLLQKDNVLTTRTPEVSDYIAFYDNSATAQGKMTLSTLGSLIGGSGGSMVYPGAGIPVSTGSAWGTSKTAPSGAIVGTTDSQVLTNKSVNGVTLSTIEGPTRFLRGDGTYQRLNIVQTLTSASSITMDIWNGSKAVLALATNSTITITNVPDGGEGSIEVTSSGAYTLAIAGSTGYTTTQKMGTTASIANNSHTTVFYWRSGTILYYGFLLNN